MLLCVRTTIKLDDELFRAYKQRAAARGTTFAQEVEEALRADLHSRSAAASRSRSSASCSTATAHGAGGYRRQPGAAGADGRRAASGGTPVILFDVNVLLNAHRPGQEHHRVARELLERSVNAPAPFALSELVLSAFVRIATNPRASGPDAARRRVPVHRPPAAALKRADRPRRRPSLDDLRGPLPAHPGARRPDRRRPARRARARARCEWISFDRDFAKFPDLRWRHPLD